jgi:cbb3-type cytochrome c oxidase subunit III
VISVEISNDILAMLVDLPHGTAIAGALPLYAANCIGCHGAEGEGTSIAPALNTPAVRAKSDTELARTITNGVPGTLMAGWSQALPAEQISQLANMIRYWDEIPAGLIPQPNLPPIASTNADTIAAGAQLYSIACSHCHGSDGQGTRMAPALNVQTFLTQTNDQAIKAIIANGVPNTKMPAWGGRLSDEELNRLVSFLRAWEPNAPAIAQPGGGTTRGGPPWMKNNK